MAKSCPNFGSYVAPKVILACACQDLSKSKYSDCVEDITFIIEALTLYGFTADRQGHVPNLLPFLGMLDLLD